MKLINLNQYEVLIQLKGRSPLCESVFYKCCIQTIDNYVDARFEHIHNLMQKVFISNNNWS